MEYQQEIREFTLGDMFSIGGNIFKKHFNKFAVATLVYYAFFVVIALLVYYTVDFSSLEAWHSNIIDIWMSSIASSPILESTYAPMIEMFKDADVGLIIAQNIIALGTWLFMFLLVFVIADMVEKCSRNEEPDLAASINKAGRKFWVGLITYLIFWITFLGLSITLIFFIPAVIMAIYWRFFLYAIIIRDMNYFQAFRYSMEVVKRRWWIVLLYSIVFWLSSSMMAGIPNFMISLAGPNLIVTILQTLVGAIITAFFIVIEAVFFINFDANARARFETERTN